VDSKASHNHFGGFIRISAANLFLPRADQFRVVSGFSRLDAGSA
jgi:hypothetical protein